MVVDENKQKLSLQDDFNLFDAFKIFDLLKVGSITHGDFRKGLEYLGVRAPKNLTKLFFKRYDRT